MVNLLFPKHKLSLTTLPEVEQKGQVILELTKNAHVDSHLNLFIIFIEV